MAGLAAEGLEYEKVVGQSADLFTLQVLYELILSSSSPVVCSILSYFLGDIFKKTASEEVPVSLLLEVHKQN
jgi:hypothetical protein